MLVSYSLIDRSLKTSFVEAHCIHTRKTHSDGPHFCLFSLYNFSGHSTQRFPSGNLRLLVSTLRNGANILSSVLEHNSSTRRAGRPSTIDELGDVVVDVLDLFVLVSFARLGRPCSSFFPLGRGRSFGVIANLLSWMCKIADNFYGDGTMDCSLGEKHSAANVLLPAFRFALGFCFASDDFFRRLHFFSIDSIHIV